MHQGFELGAAVLVCIMLGVLRRCVLCVAGGWRGIEQRVLGRLCSKGIWLVA